MHNTFNWKHVFALGVIVCLLSVVAGAALAQEEPEIPEAPGIDLPEPEAPVVVPMEADVMEAPAIEIDLGGGDGDFVSIPDAASAAGLTTLLAAVEAAGLGEALTTLNPITVFAPTEAAFAQLLSDLGVTAEELLANTELLTTVLTYHVAPGNLSAADLIALNGSSINTVQGTAIAVGGTDTSVVLDGDVNVVTADVAVDNGVVHVIDKVLLPDTTSAVTAAPTGLSPEGLVDAIPSNFNWTPVPGSLGSLFQIFETPEGGIPEGATPLTSTTVSGGALTVTAKMLSLLTLSPEDVEVRDGFRYTWRVAGLDAAGDAGPFATASFQIQVPQISPMTGTTVYVDQPFITWPVLPGVDWYEVVAYVPEGIDGEDYVTFLDFYPAADTPFGAPYDNGICDDTECVAFPYDSLQIEDLSGFDDGNFAFLGTGEIQIYIRAYTQTGSGTDIEITPIAPPGGFEDVGDNYFLLTEFTMQAPDGLTISPTDIATEPEFIIDRNEFSIDRDRFGNLLGTTITAAPEAYRLFFIGQEGTGPEGEDPLVLGNDAFWIVQTNDMNECIDDDGAFTFDCILEPPADYDGLYNGTYDLYVQGYVSDNASYTPWSDAIEIVVNNPAPTADSIALAGVYENVGNEWDIRSTNPYAMTSTWTPCGGVAGDAPTADPACDTVFPLVHIAPNQMGDSGPWLRIVIYNVGDVEVEVDVWANQYTNDIFDNLDDAGSEYFRCDTGFGGGAFDFQTCFFQSGTPLELGEDYAYYVESYGAGGSSTGGIAEGFAGPLDFTVTFFAD